MHIITPYIIWNLIVCILYGIDKRRAEKDAWRISEKTLILCAVCLGAVGAYAGMKLFRHKTKHMKFQIIIPVLALLNFAFLVVIGVAPEKLGNIFKL